MKTKTTTAGARTHETTCLAGIDASAHECTCGNSAVTRPLNTGDRTHRTIDRALSEKRWCYYVPAIQDVKKYGGFVPSLVVENEAGHSPMTGATGNEAPWVWGDTLEQAEEVAAAVNAKRGISARDAIMIVASSMGASRRAA